LLTSILRITGCVFAESHSLNTQSDTWFASSATNS
jgi:hypothetical protein